MEPEFLTPFEVQELTDYSMSSSQCKQLDDMGIRYVVGRSGKPKVCRAALRTMMGFKAERGTKAFTLPNLED